MKSLISGRHASILSVLLLIAGCSSASGDAGTGSSNDGPGGIAGPSTSAPLNAGIGEVCTADSTCPAGLSCRVDTTNWISHHQCTSSCAADADCTSRFGNHTMCIGAGICVSKCLDDSNCPKGTLCSTNGWCANDGPGSGVPRCAGTPTPCSRLSDTACATALGCRSSGQCGGVGASCFGQLDSFSCSRVSGCYWSAGSSTCSGLASPCSNQVSQYTCAEQTGCSWSSSCTGTPSSTSCESAGPTLCEYTAGCSLVAQ